jgi:archaeosortase A (PGF-CTERM-specific)
MLDQLSTLGSFAEPVGWVVLAVFLLGVALEYAGYPDRSRSVFVFAWVLFAGFWLLLIYPWFAEDQSIIRGAGATLAVPLSLLVAKAFYEGRESLATLSRAVAFMGLIYAPVVMIPVLHDRLILIVVDHTEFLMNLIGYDPPVVVELSEVGLDREISGKNSDLRNSFVFFPYEDVSVTYSIVVACTGIGSMAVIAGLVAAVRAPLDRKLTALALTIPIIYVLNIVRNVFIGINYGHQYAQFFPDLTMTLFGVDNPVRVSYLWADRIIAQSMSVVAMLLIIWIVVRVLPEVLGVIEDLLYLLTGTEYDLDEVLDVSASESSDEA